MQSEEPQTSEETGSVEPDAEPMAPDPTHSLTGEFQYHRELSSQFLDHRRDVIVYLPPGYHSEVERRYPVLYLHDGQNLFDRATAFAGQEWGVDQTMQKLILSGEIDPLIVVGIYNTGEHRIEEYTPTYDPSQKSGGKANQYGRFIVEELKSLIDHHYRTLADVEHTGLGGSSLGGLVTLYLGLKYPQIFSKLMVMSPSVWWDHGVILSVVRAIKAKPSTRIWLDVGTNEGKFTPGHIYKLRDTLIAQGWRLNADLKFLEVKGGLHNEQAWGERVEPALKFLFPKHSDQRPRPA